ncbi:MAG TPA: glucose 1-dehydrogenase [Candidatus Polarisedimenticolia bacterium]|nr:glucose 1-dehydrogenase [Candidatus Polarisedimenticolia bacterium]
MSELAGKSALVTGGGSGLGRAIALRFASEGASVTVAGRRRQALEAAAGEGSGRVAAVAGDVTREDDRARFVEAALRPSGTLDILVNAAGILEAGSLRSTTHEAWDRSLDVNLRSIYALTRLAAPHLEEARGSILNLSSVAGLRPYPGLLAYCVSKAALDQLTRCLALELAPLGVRVNALNPGVVVTDLHRAGGMSAEDYAAFLERGKTTHPLGRVGRPDDVAAFALFLSSDRAGWVTGGTFSVDGGRALASAR